jgi:CHAT domain
MLGESGAELRRGVNPSLVSRERQLAVLLDAKADRLIALQGRAASPEAEALSREARTLEAEYEEVRSAIRAASPQYGALTQPRLLEAETIQRVLLDADTTLLEYSVGRDSSFVWVVDREGLRSYRLAPRAAIEQATREAYDLVTARAVSPPTETAQERARRIAKADAAVPGALRRVTDLVLTPIGVLPKTPRLVVVADGVLQYLPFEMLPVPRISGERQRPMIVDFEIVTLPSASTLSVQRARTAGRQRPLLGVAVFADPVFDVSDARVRGKRAASVSDAARTRILAHTTETTVASSSRIARLPFTDEEAKAILNTASGQKNLAAIGFAATKESLVGSALSAYRYVHFATHGFLDTERPSLSAIALSLVDVAGSPKEGFLRAHELYNLDLSADLVVLSACQTGLGKEIRGEGLVGLTRAFMYAGAARVIVSLWSISDRATATLMARLYREMLRDGKTPAASLRAAQLFLRSNPQWEHPYFWAAFILQGDWR